MAKLGPERGLVVAGWAVSVLVAVLMAIARLQELGPAVVFGVIAVAMGTWVLLRGGKAAMITSLVLGALWTLQFLAYAVAGVSDGGTSLTGLVFVTDVIAVVGGLCILGGSASALVGRRRGSMAAPGH